MPRGWWGVVPWGGGLPPLCGAPGVRRCPPPGRPSSRVGSLGSATRVSRVRSVRAWGPSTGPTACALAGWRCSLWGWRKGVPGGGAFHCCEGRLVSGAVPPPAARPLERAVRVPRPVCPGCGRCGRGAPAPAPQRAPLRAGVARRGDGGRTSPGGVPSTIVRGAWCQALSLPQPPVLWSGQPGFRVPCVPGAVGAGVGTQHRPHSVRPCGLALLAVGVAEGRPSGVLSTVVRGAWCQALSLPRPPVLWSGQPGFRVPCVPGAVGSGVGTQHRSLWSLFHASLRQPSPKSRAVVERTGCVQHLKSENVLGLAAEPNGSACQSEPEAVHIGARGDPQLKVTHGCMQRDVEVHGQKQSPGHRPTGEEGQAVGRRCPGQHNSYIRQCQVSTARHDNHTILSMIGVRR